MIFNQSLSFELRNSYIISLGCSSRDNNLNPFVLNVSIHTWIGDNENFSIIWEDNFQRKILPTFTNWFWVIHVLNKNNSLSKKTFALKVGRNDAKVLIYFSKGVSGNF